MPEKNAKCIGLIGLKQHGKDTAADLLVKHYDFHKYAFAAHLKELCAQEFGFTHSQIHGGRKEIPDPRWCDKNGHPVTPRFVLQQLGTEGFRSIDPDFWVKYLFNSVDFSKNVVVSDVRFENEMDAILAHNGCLWVVDMLHKPDPESIFSKAKNKILRRGSYHASEKLARKLVRLGRAGALDPQFIYVPFVFGEPGRNKSVISKAITATNVIMKVNC